VGIQGPRPVAVAPDPRFRAHEGIDYSLEKRRASFETAAARSPQDEDFSNAINNIPHAEKRRRARLEARTTSGQRISSLASGLFDGLGFHLVVGVEADHVLDFLAQGGELVVADAGVSGLEHLGQGFLHEVHGDPEEELSVDAAR
jgi:hypothetical protein